MKKKIHYIMPMAGRGSRFLNQGYDFPKPLIKIYERPFFYWSTRSVEKFVDIVSLDFVVLKEHVDSFNIDTEIKRYFPNANIHVLPEVTEGAVITCMRGIQEIDDDYPLVFNDCDHLFKSSDFNMFCDGAFDETIDGLLLTFLSDEPKYSFVEKNNKNCVIRTVEKEVISNEAICGCYYFKNKEIFMECAKLYLKECNYSEYFLSGVYNVMINRGMTVKSMPTDYHVPFGVPDEYETACGDLNYRELL